ncbi:MAG: metallophosphoesterase family protein [Myxococcota bacterium]
MLKFSSEPADAAREMEAVLFYLTAFGYIDGRFDRSERDFIEEFILELAASQETDSATAAGRARRAALVDRLDRKFQRISAELKAMWDEPTAEGERALSFVRSRVKVRCFEILEGFAREDRKVLMDAVDQMLAADGIADPEEIQFRTELLAFLDTKQPSAAGRAGHTGEAKGRRNRVVIHPHVERPRSEANHPALTQLERHFAVEPDLLRRQLGADLQRMSKVTKIIEAKRAGNRGNLAGYHTVQELAGRPAFLDEHVYVIPPTTPAGYELTVLGDLHGCYSCLKAALMQSDFMGKVERFTRSPTAYPEPLLVLLGDYIDRGLYSLNGVLRAVLGLSVAAPRHVIALRGNHEYYLEKDGMVYGGVRPAEAIDKLKPYAPVEVFQAYRQFFETMPNMLVFDDILFVHGGIPRDATLRERYTDLSSLNDPTIRFQMMWSDPSSADFVPEDLQAASNRFSFGREQARAFMHGMGVRTLIRGHEKVDAGFVSAYDEPDLRVLTLFSAGGADNNDLPARSSYRAVTPTALTIRYYDGRTDIEPWVIDYAAYNDPERNEFFNSEPEMG